MLKKTRKIKCKEAKYSTLEAGADNRVNTEEKKGNNRDWARK